MASREITVKMTDLPAVVATVKQLQSVIEAAAAIFGEIRDMHLDGDDSPMCIACGDFWPCTTSALIAGWDELLGTFSPPGGEFTEPMFGRLSAAVTFEDDSPPGEGE